MEFKEVKSESIRTIIYFQIELKVGIIFMPPDPAFLWEEDCRNKENHSPDVAVARNEPTSGVAATAANCIGSARPPNPCCSDVDAAAREEAKFAVRDGGGGGSSSSSITHK